MTQQVVTLQPGEKYQVNACISGYILNPNATSASFTVTNPVGNVIKTLLPYRSWNFSSLEFDYLINTGTNAIELDISPGTGTNVSESINTLFGTVTIAGNVNVSGSVSIIGVVSISGNVNITNTTLNISGSVNILGYVSITGTVNISGSVSIIGSVTVAGSVAITNTTLNISGSVNILGYVSITGTVNISGNVSIIGSVTVAGSVAITNTTLNISGSVNILGYVSITGTVNISGTVAITGTVNVTGNINITNSTVNISGGVNIYQSISLPTDIGGFSTDLQENQSTPVNALTYNPWGFSTSVNPTARAFDTSNDFCNVQQNGASGYLTFYFNVYNPTSASASANITVYLYDHLPESGPTSTPINQFTFSTGTLAAGAQAWVTVNPNIFWAYNSLIVIPQQQTGTSGTAIGITNPNSFNSINSHYWNGGGYWNQSDDGFIGYWTIVSAAPASLPVAITNPVRVSEGNVANASSSTASDNFLLATVPNGKKWKLLGAYMTGNTGTATSFTLAITIYRNGINNILIYGPASGSEILVFYNNSSATANVSYSAYGNISGISNPLNSTSGSVLGTTWRNYPILYAGDKIYASNTLQSSNYSAIYYVESDI
jgi:UDP-3-O-[3-hydroxymyristoyl] glucosamine N-acyltransferase